MRPTLSLLSVLSLGIVVTGCEPGPDDDLFDVEGCGPNAPSFTEITVTDVGDQTFGGESRPAVQVAVDADDPDGDLHVYTVWLWYDTFVDGLLPDLPEIQRTVELAPEQPCEITTATAGLVLPLGADDVPAGTVVEFGFVLRDAAGRSSFDGEPVITEVTTPDI